MADFCKTCSEELFGKEVDNDFKGMITQEQIDDGYYMPVLCEGCGYICVDSEGYCIEILNKPEDG